MGDVIKMLKIQQYLDCFDSIKDGNMYLRTNLNIEAECQTIKAFGDEPATVVYLYNCNRKANIDNTIVKEAHGLILHTDGDLISKMIDFPIEVESPSLFSSAGHKFFEIPDGEFVSVYNLEGNWHVSTVDSVNGSNYLKTDANLAQGFWETVGKNKFKTTSPDLIYVFIFVSKYNKKLLPYSGQTAYLVAVIDRTTGEELPINTVRNIAKKIGFTSIAETNSFHTLSPGLFILNEDGKRFYFRNKIYTAVKNALDAGERVTPTHMAKIIHAARHDRDVDVISMNYRRYEFMLDLMLIARDRTRKELYHLWNNMSEEVKLNNKKFAETVCKHPFNYLLFMFKDGKINSIFEEMKRLKPERLVELVRELEPSKFNAYSKIIKREVGDSKS
jgi:hypothetical protein